MAVLVLSHVLRVQCRIQYIVRHAGLLCLLRARRRLCYVRLRSHVPIYGWAAAPRLQSAV